MAVQFLKFFSAFLALFLFCLPAFAADDSADEMAADGARWAAAAGYFDILEGGGAAQFNLEYRGDYYWQHLRPTLGISVDLDGGLYAYGGGYYDFWLDDDWVLSPNFVVGAYVENGGKDLGHVLEFRSGLELGYQFESGRSLGVAFNHISNASLGDANPGGESLMLVYSWPFSF